MVAGCSSVGGGGGGGGGGGDVQVHLLVLLSQCQPSEGTLALQGDIN